VRSTSESVDEVVSLLPDGQDHRSVRLREPFFHGDTCMNLLAGSTPTFLVLPSAFATPDEYRKAREAASAVAEVLEITEADALAYACNSLGLGDEVLIPTGLSEELRRTLSRRGYRLRQLNFAELFGKGGGGPRCLVNDLGIAASQPTSSRYSELRPSLHAMLEDYPTSEAS
jgi:N-dimethylarginine dimethylaminohydrolase